MTINAATRSLPEGNRGLVAVLAPRRLMGALEFEIRMRVIERLPIQLDNVGVSPLVVGVAVPAVLAQGLGMATMKAFPLLTIRGDILVARGTKPGL